MFDNAKRQLQPIADIPRNVQIMTTLSLVTLAVCLVTLAVVLGGVRDISRAVR